MVNMVNAAVLAGVVVLLFQGSTGSAVAQPVGTDKCECVCMSGQDADGNGGRTSFLIYESAEFSICPIFNDRSCEIEDRDTGVRHYGTTEMCEPLSDLRYEELKSGREE